MSWALIASSAIPDQPGAFLAASPDIIAILEEDGDGRYLAIFPEGDEGGVFLWEGTITASEEDVECVGTLRELEDKVIRFHLLKNNLPPDDIY